MATETMNAARERAEKRINDGVENREDLFEALPMLIELQEKINGGRKHLNASIEAAKALADLCSAYVLKHPSVFDEKMLLETQQGVQIGDVTVEDRVFHFAHGYDGYERPNKAQMRREFLETLPVEWLKTTKELNVSAVNKAKPTEEQLAEHGLQQKVKNQWSEQEAA